MSKLCRLSAVVHGSKYYVGHHVCLMVWVMVRHVCVVRYGGLWPYGPVKGGMGNVICMMCWSAVRRVPCE